MSTLLPATLIPAAVLALCATAITSLPSPVTAVPPPPPPDPPGVLAIGEDGPIDSNPLCTGLSFYQKWGKLHGKLWNESLETEPHPDPTPNLTTPQP